ncbi:protein cappuccino-like isoform X1 [Mustela erminea]|uniref:protein cappuccino-like isoform X1 n=1 Tax=Mustela erminea TaxID=36723 RepID=UPI001386B2AD|nr:protein cappuccino-like isoform X1 [Mustela erminea]
MAGRRGQRGAGPPTAGRVKPPPARRPASPPPPSLRPSLPGCPARLPGSHFPPTRFAALGGQAGMERSCSRWASLPPPLPALASLPQHARSTVSFEDAGRSPFPGRSFSCQQLFFFGHGTHRREWLSKTEVNPVYKEQPCLYGT